jgi:hypothetical protein
MPHTLIQAEGNQPIMLGGDLIVAIDGQQITDPQDSAPIRMRSKVEIATIGLSAFFEAGDA